MEIAVREEVKNFPVEIYRYLYTRGIVPFKVLAELAEGIATLKVHFERSGKRQS